MKIARKSDLELTEFRAFNYGNNFPTMRRWELPFALFEARLDATSAVLDCSINPAGFGMRLLELYPCAIYHHSNPVPAGRLELPFGLPDEAFDRVFCINTLEHLLESQRSALIAEMARKLKPGGLLIVTCDHYFESFWSNPKILGMGVIRADGQEVFNGWNRVAWPALIEQCRHEGLQPFHGTSSDVVNAGPKETDPELYRNCDAWPHACVADAFYKAAPPELVSRRIVLALLTWNKRDISLNSTGAYIAEARMLERLGHEPFIVVCDNGSEDGTAAALTAELATSGVEHRVIANRKNLGNSVARNQIVHVMLETGADYVLFMDGDIEVIPFSSMAMMRYMEDHGTRLGSIGANSSEHTPDRGQATPFLYSIHTLRRESGTSVAWTQYGMFRREVFEEGIAFDESGPFAGPGWGFEDNDLAFQMELKGFVNQRFFGAKYLHREVRSSLRLLEERGMDAAALCAGRRTHLVNKWANVPQINNGPLNEIRNLRLP